MKKAAPEIGKQGETLEKLHRREWEGMKRGLLLAAAVTLLLAGTACAGNVGLMIVPVEPVRVNGAVVQAISEAFSSEFPGSTIVPALVASGDATQGLGKISSELTAGNWDYGARVRLEMTRLMGTVSFFKRKMAVTAYANVEIFSKSGSVFNQKFEGKAVGDASANAGPLFLQALNEALDAFKEAFTL